MRILVSGEAGPVISGVVPELLRHGHSIRRGSPSAAEESARWPRVEPFAGVRGAAAGCDTVVHIGTLDAAETLEEAGRESTLRRFVYVVPGGSDRDVEPAIERSALDWLIVRHASVYGPHDDVISPVLKIVRSLPIVLVDRGEQSIRPIWYEDLAKGIDALVERGVRGRRVIEIAGRESITLNQLLDRLREITARHPMRVPLPHLLERIAVAFPDEALDAPMHLADFGVDDTPLDRGLRLLADATAEQFLDEGVGKMHHKRYWADIRGSFYSPEALISIFRERVNEMIAIDFAAEPGAPERIAKGATMTMALPIRGHVQIRVEKVEPAKVVFVTLEGHPIAGMVEFTATEPAPGVVRFAIDNFSRSGNFLDHFPLRTIGEPAQSANWRRVVQNMIDASGGTSDGVLTDSRIVDEDVAAGIERNLRDVVEARQREESAAPERPAQR